MSLAWVLANTVLYFAVYNVHPCLWCTLYKFSGKKIFDFNVLIQLLVYLYLETKPMIIFQSIILHTDTVIAF